MYVQISGLTFSYRNAKEKTIQDAAMSIEKGEIVTILGQSGSGKSTILRLIAGLELPEAGTIIINDQVMTNDKIFVQPEKRGVGMVFQDYALFPHMTVAANIRFGLKTMKRQERDERLKAVMALVGLTGFEKRYPYELSGGQQQRVALARAMAPNPALILFDEPFSNLDADLQIKIRDELRDILKTAGITSIFVTHDQEDAKAIADRVIVIENGHITKIGTPELILT
jgi:iron(III) transport system ATP-binding protein